MSKASLLFLPFAPAAVITFFASLAGGRFEQILKIGGGQRGRILLLFDRRFFFRYGHRLSPLAECGQIIPILFHFLGEIGVETVFMRLHQLLIGRIGVAVARQRHVLLTGKNVLHAANVYVADGSALFHGNSGGHAGGLTRAYAKGAKDALIASGAATMGLWVQCEIPCNYPLLERVKLEVENVGGMVDGVEYGADVVISASLLHEEADTLQERLTELSAGAITLTRKGEEYRPGPREEVI